MKSNVKDIYIYIFMPDSCFKLVAGQKVSSQSWIFQWQKSDTTGKEVTLFIHGNFSCVQRLPSLGPLCNWNLTWTACFLVWLAGWGLCRFCSLQNWFLIKNRNEKGKQTERLELGKVPNYRSDTIFCLFVNLLYLVILTISFPMWHHFVTSLACFWLFTLLVTFKVFKWWPTPIVIPKVVQGYFSLAITWKPPLVIHFCSPGLSEGDEVVYKVIVWYWMQLLLLPATYCT